jgi:hypothetical protein
MNWLILVIVIFINSLFCIFQYTIQQIDKSKGRIPARNSIIPGTNQKFLYWQDFYNQTYGDFFGLVWIMNAFSQLLVKGQISKFEWLIFIFLAIGSASAFLLMNLRLSHKPDWGYPLKGEVSWGGLSHLPYFGSLFAMAAICFVKIASGEINGILLWTVVVSILIYTTTTILDIKSGNFDPIKKIRS